MAEEIELGTAAAGSGIPGGTGNQQSTTSKKRRPWSAAVVAQELNQLLAGHQSRPHPAGAGAGVPKPGSFGGAGLGGVSGKGVPAGAPSMGPTFVGGLGGGVK